MRNDSRSGGMVIALAIAILVSGCARETLVGAMPHDSRLSLKDSVPHTRAPAQPKRTKATTSLRQFCGDRHVLFQARKLKENPDQMARNNAKCRKLYLPG